MYEASLKRLADEIDMEEHGYKKGIRDKSIQIATDMKKDGVDSKSIAKWTNLTLEEIENL